jgi:uncharacterized membrane protein YozB (DUF420 family)
VAPLFSLGTLLVAVLAVLAFWPNYLSRPFGSLDAYTHLHAFAGTLWLGFLVSQPLLIKLGRRSWHRHMGRASLAGAVLFVASSILLAHYRFSRMDPATFSREAYTLYLPLSAAALFTYSVAMAVAWRHHTMLHARFMAGTALLLLDPVLSRVLAFYVVELPQFWHYQLITFGLEIILLALLFRTMPPTVPERKNFARYGSIYATVLVLWFFLPRTGAWTAFASWFRSLSLT